MASFNNSPANTVTLVVPSPTSLSWEIATSVKLLAAGCPMSSSLIIVAPSLEITDLSFTLINLSDPLGPKVVFTTSTTPIQALIFEIIWSFPC